MPRRLQQLLLLGGMSWLSWLGMMLVHEAGHVLASVCTGGTVTQFVWYPTALSRTDVSPNPHPLLEVWAGPVVGSLVPVILAAMLARFGVRAAYLYLFFAGFCLIANGTYIGIGATWPVGDAKVLIALGTPRLWLALFGVLTVLPGFMIWNRISPRFGFGTSPIPIRTTHVVITLIFAATLTVVCFAAGGTASLVK